jgi:hypothetical protein
MPGILFFILIREICNDIGDRLPIGGIRMLVAI